MTAREELQCCYEYAFHPPSLNHLWQQIKKGELRGEDVKPLLDKALLLHMALPESGYSSQRALQRLALYQAKSRAFGMPAFIRNIRKTLGCEPLAAQTVPAALVRDIGLPPFSHAPQVTPHQQPGKVGGNSMTTPEDKTMTGSEQQPPCFG